ncbi:MAG: hypothetical protein WD066_13975 [Planctomycetaceae bacterium]
MTVPSSYSLLAQGEGCTAVAVAFVVITIIGWIMQLVTGAKQGQQRAGRPVRPPRPRDDRLQSEIDLFLEEVDGRRRPPPPQRPSAVPAILEVVPEDRKELGRRSTIRPHTEKSPPSPAPTLPGTSRRQRSEARPAAADGTGSDVRAPRRELTDVPRHIVPESDYLTSAQELGGAEHLGAFVGGGGGSARGAGGTHPVVSLARNPHGMKQAIVLTEILGRPLARRERKSRD